MTNSDITTKSKLPALKKRTSQVIDLRLSTSRRSKAMIISVMTVSRGHRPPLLLLLGFQD